MKPLMILPNFRIILLDPQYKDKIIQFTEYESDNQYILSPKSFWRGLNNTGLDFLSELKEMADEIPDNVLVELDNWNRKYGIVSLMDDICTISNAEVLEEILMLEAIQEIIHKNEEGHIVVTNIKKFVEILENDLDCPVKVETSDKVYETKKIKILNEINDLIVSAQPMLEKIFKR